MMSALDEPSIANGRMREELEYLAKNKKEWARRVMAVLHRDGFKSVQ